MLLGIFLVNIYGHIGHFECWFPIFSFVNCISDYDLSHFVEIQNEVCMASNNHPTKFLANKRPWIIRMPAKILYMPFAEQFFHGFNKKATTVKSYIFFSHRENIENLSINSEQ